MNLIFSKLGISSLPCRKCGYDTLHVGGVCNTCDTRHEPEVIHREVGGAEYHRAKGVRDWERRKARP